MVKNIDPDVINVCSPTRKVLLVRQAETPQREYDITDMAAVSLGSHPANDIILSGEEADVFHAGIYRDRGGKCFIQDLGSRHTFKVNSSKCEYRPLVKSDIISIGSAAVIYDELPLESVSRRRKIQLSDAEPIQVKEFSGSGDADDVICQVLENPEYLRLLYSVAHVANAAHDAELSIQAVTEKLHTVYGADRTFSARFRGADLPLDLISCCPADPSESLTVCRAIIRRLLAERRPLVSTDIGSDERFFTGDSPTKSVAQYPFRSIVWLPLLDEDSVVGLFCLEWRTDTKNRRSEELLRALSMEISASFTRCVRSETLQERVDFLEAVAIGEGLVMPPIGISKSTRDLVVKARNIARHDGTVLMTGPTGSGKQVVAQFIHQSSSRRHKPFLDVDCTNILDTTAESVLFGVIANYPGFHNKETLIGKFELADGGTLFLDEIGDLSPNVQTKLLKALEQKMIWPLGAKEPKKIDVKIIAATKTDLDEAMQNGKFRDDLYERLNMFRLEIAPLSERMEDIPLIVGFFLNVLREETGMNVTRFSHKAMEKLMRHSWPRNVRELRNQVTRAFYNAENTAILPHHLELAAGKEKPFPTLAETEKEHIQKALQKTGGKKEPAARLLGIVKQTLYNKCSEYGLE